MPLLVFLLILFAALPGPSRASNLREAADGSLVIEGRDSRPAAAQDTLRDFKALESQVQVFISRSRLQVWELPRGAYRPYSSNWQRLPHPQVEALIHKYAHQYGVDPNLVRAVMRHESGFNTNALSPKGAQGLMQLMPGTANLMGVRNPFDPEENIAGGVGYLRRCLDRFQNNAALAVAAYNAGPEAVARYGTVPPYTETQTFVGNVMGTYTGQRQPAATIPPKTTTAGAKMITKKSTPVPVQLTNEPRRSRAKIIEVRPTQGQRRPPGDS